tara:strand:+ start:807 stop:1355 length:549 start_codon:yes stop_codon:yes gene_type:complete
MAYIDTHLFSEIETFKKIQFNSEIGHFTNLFETSWLNKNFLQDSVSFARLRGTIKGFHFQKKPFDQAKLVSVIQGSILDIFIDIRKGSKTFLDHGSIILKEGNSNIIYIPRGFAHGYITLEDNTLINYKLDNHYSPDHEETILYNDPFLAVEFPDMDGYHLSKKDKNGSTIEELKLKSAFDD